MFVNKLMTYLTFTYLKGKRCYNVTSSTYYFHVKTKILAEFQICISVPLAKGLWDEFLRKATELSGNWKIVPENFGHFCFHHFLPKKSFASVKKRLLTSRGGIETKITSVVVSCLFFAMHYCYLHYTSIIAI